MNERVIRAGTAYFAIVFLAGFVLGTIRTLVLEPWVGELAATVLELPLILGVSWLVCGWVVGRWRIPAAPAARLAMGGLAFALLMAAEVGLARTIGDGFRAFVADLSTPAGALGLGGQLVFAIMPLLRRTL